MSKIVHIRRCPELFGIVQIHRCPELSEIVQIDTVKSHFKALGLYNFKRGFGWAYKWGAYIRVGLFISRIKKCFGGTRQNISDNEKQIKANIPLHVELHL